MSNAKMAASREIVISVSSAAYHETWTKADDEEGLDPEEYIIEIRCTELVDNQLSGKTFHVYVKPQVDLKHMNLPQYDIDAEFLFDKPTFRGISSGLKDFIGNSKIVAYSENYERGALNREFQRIDEKGYEKDQFIDVGLLAQDYFKDAQDIRGIDSVMDVLGIIPIADLDDSADAFITAVSEVYTKIRAEINISAIPLVPNQGAGPHFELNSSGIVDIVNNTYLDNQGNNIKTLNSLHPLLKELTQNIQLKLSTGNIPHKNLLNRIEDYYAVISQDLQEVNFAILYGLGIRLENSVRSVQIEIEKLELPRFAEETFEEIESLVRLHGAFILSTADGKELIEAEDRFARTPEQEHDLQAAISNLSEKLELRPDLVSQTSTHLMGVYAKESLSNQDITRASVFSSSTASNLSVVIAAAAIVGALPIIGSAALGMSGTLSGGILALIGVEGLKKSKAFTNTTKIVTDNLDSINHSDLENFVRKRSVDLRPFLEFVLQNENTLRHIAGKRVRFSWIHQILDWLGQIKK